MTHSMEMGPRHTPLVFLLAAATLAAQTSDEDFKIYKDHPRLLLTSQRLRLLKRERERSSARWQQFDTLMRGKAQMTEPGFASALYYQVTASESAAKQAIQWALGPAATDLRQLAIVYDWCQPAMSPTDSAALKRKITAALKIDWQTASLPAARSVAFGLIALGDEFPGGAKLLNQLVNTWWRGKYAPALKSGSQSPVGAQLYPLFELMHVVRDATSVEMREDAALYFRDLPAKELLNYYPAIYPAAENEFRIPAFTGKEEPDLQAAALSRIAELAMVAYDNTSTDSQFVQGWVSHDRFILHGAFGAPYEFFWANPYQPGLSYYHLPLTIHDGQAGRLYMRSSWDDDATWLGYIDGELQLFEDGKIRQIQLQPQTQPKLITIGEAAVIPGKANLRFTIPENGPTTVYVIGLKPNQTYTIEVDDEELDAATTDRAGNLPLKSTRKDARGVRLSPPGT